MDRIDMGHWMYDGRVVKVMDSRPVTHFVIKCSGHLPVISLLYLSRLSFPNKPVNHNIGDKLLKVAIYTNNRIWIFHFRFYGI